MEALTVLIASLALWIAYQQWKMNSMRYKHELYQRRLNVYKTVIRMLKDAHAANHHTVETMQDAMLESYFLFNKEIPTYIEELSIIVSNVAQINLIMKDGHSDLTLKKRWKEQVDEIKGKEKAARELFMPYLSLTKR